MTIADELAPAKVGVTEVGQACAAMGWAIQARWDLMRLAVSRMTPALARDVALAASWLNAVACVRAGIPVDEVLPGGAP